MTSKEVALNLAEAFNRSDVDGIMNYFADDGEWNMLGDGIYNGKEKVREMFIPHAAMKVVTCTFDHVIAEGNMVSISGYVECKGNDGKQMNMFYCDIYEVEDDKVKKMTSYVVEKK